MIFKSGIAKPHISIVLLYSYRWCAESVVVLQIAETTGEVKAASRLLGGGLLLSSKPAMLERALLTLMSREI